MEAVAKMRIKALKKEDYPSVSAIYKEGLETGLASFETKVLNWEAWDKKFLKSCRFVVMIEDNVVAWCGLSPVSSRKVYNGVAEDTIYVSSEFQGKGIGQSLLKYLISESESNGFWTLQAGIFSDNIASIRLHEQCGFRIIGKREKIAKRDGIWYDNIIMERRSKLF